MFPMVFCYTFDGFSQIQYPLCYNQVQQPLPYESLLNSMVIFSPSSFQDQRNNIVGNNNQGFTRVKSLMAAKNETTQKTIKDTDLDNQEKPAKRKQNPLRNIYTNLTNSVLNFISCKKKIGNLLQDIDPSLVGQKLCQFYKYIKYLKSYFCSYFNIQKVKKLFNGTSIPHLNKEFHRVLRIAAKIILQEKMPTCLLTSKKLSCSLLQQHLSGRRTMILILRHPSTHF